MASFGEELRRQRELRSISLREISDATKINIRFLESLEENDFKHLPGGQFNKGFIRAYARHIGVDGEDMVNAYILEVRRQEDEAPAGRASAARPRLDPADKRALAALGILGVLVVLLVLGVWFLIFHGRKTKSAAAPLRPAVERRHAGTEASGTAPAGTAPAPSPTRHPEASSPAATPKDALGAAGASGSAGTTPPATGGQASAAPATPPDDRDARAALAAAGGEMALRVVPLQTVKFGLLCDGKEAYSGTLEPGRPQTFTCAGVYEITVEDAGAVNLSVNGDRIYVGRPGQSIAGRHVSRANLPDFLNPPYEPAPR